MVLSLKQDRGECQSVDDNNLVLHLSNPSNSNNNSTEVPVGYSDDLPTHSNSRKAADVVV